jgi:hypothetical protein
VAASVLPAAALPLSQMATLAPCTCGDAHRLMVAALILLAAGVVAIGRLIMLRVAELYLSVHHPLSCPISAMLLAEGKPL